MMQRNASHADGTGSAFWTRLGVSVGLWLYVNAALLVWAYGWPAWLLGIAASTAAIAAGIWATGRLYPTFCVVSAAAFWMVALLTDGERHPGRTLFAWAATAAVLTAAAAVAGALAQRPAAAPAEPSVGPLPPGPDGEPAPSPAYPRAPVPALHAAAEADLDQD